MSAAKVIIFKNTISEPVTVTELGLTILPGEQSDIEYEEILILEDSQELIDFINSGVVVVNDGVRDLNNIEALEYLQIGSDLVANYYNKQETDQIINNIVVNNITNIEQQLVEDYYSRAQVDSLISGIEGYGIKGAVDDVENLPSPYTGSVGDIYIVRMTTGQGQPGPQAYTPNTDSALYLPFEENKEWEDALNHSGKKYSSAEAKDGPLDPPFGTRYADFDGDNDWLKFYSNSDFGEGPTLTVGGWVYAEEGGCRGIIGRWNNNNDGWKLDIYGGKLRASLDTTAIYPTQVVDPNQLTLNKWIHVAFVYDGYYLKLYRNATEVNRVSATGTQIESWNLDVWVGRYMGNDDDDDPEEDELWHGGMKDLFIQNSPMTQEELQSLVVGNFESFSDEGFYQWDGSDWIFLSRNTGDNGGGSGSSYHNSLLGLNSDDYQHLSSAEKLSLTGGNDTDLHKHDDRYYTESEIDSRLSLKSDTNHTHSQYISQAQVDTKIQQITYSTISSNDTSTNVTGAELEELTNGSNADHLHTHSSGDINISGNGLDDAYDNHSQWQPGVGRTINVDQGSVTLQASNGFAPIRLNPIEYKPNQWLAGGEICVYDGDMFLYDATRGKWLSVSGHFHGGGINSNNARNCYLRGFNGTSFSSNVGWAAHWPGTVVSFSITSDSNGSSNSVEIRKNGSPIYSLGYSNQREQHRTNLNVDFEAGDVINFYVDGNDNDVDRPQVWARIKRRIP
mgnify:CR=1 FL=1|jgi:hypothetical protein